MMTPLLASLAVLVPFSDPPRTVPAASNPGDPPVLAARKHHPHDVIDAIAFAPGFPTDPTVLLASEGSIHVMLRSQNRGFTWQSCRGGVRGAKVLDYAMSPNWETQKVAYVAMGRDGVQRSVDGGKTWEAPLYRGLVLDIETAKSGDDHIAVLVGPRNLGYTVGGRPPVPVPVKLQAGETIIDVSLARDFDKDPIVAFVTRQSPVSGSLYISVDGGKSWKSQELPGSPRRVHVSPNFTADDTILVATFGAGVLRSTDGGMTFEGSNAGLGDMNVNDVDMAPTFPACQDVFVATKDAGVFRSSDGGANWEKTGLGIEQTWQTTNHFRRVLVSPSYPADPSLACACYEGFYLSNDKGRSWHESNINPTRMGRRVAFSPDYATDKTMFSMGYGMQLCVSEDQGSTWQPRFTGMLIGGGYALSISPYFKDDQMVFVGAAYGVRRSTDAGRTWTRIDIDPFTKEGPKRSNELRYLPFSPNFAEDRTMFAINTSGTYRSTDAGETWKAMPPGPDRPHGIVVSPNFVEDQTLFTAGQSLHKSTDGGKSWGPALIDRRIKGLVFDPNYKETNELYIVDPSEGFGISTDGGQTFNASKEPLEGFAPVNLQLSPNYSDDGTMFLATSGGGLFKSTDRGRSWSRLTEIGSVVDDVVSFAISPAFDDDQTMLIGNFDGVWKSTDGGQSWQVSRTWEHYDDRRDPWRWEGDWRHPARKDALVSGIAVTFKRGDAAVLPFAGKKIRLHGAKGPNYGNVTIYLDGKQIQEVDCYAEAEVANQMLFEADVDWGYHELRVVTGTSKNEKSSGFKAGIDGAFVDFVGPHDNVPVFAGPKWPEVSKDGGAPAAAGPLPEGRAALVRELEAAVERMEAELLRTRAILQRLKGDG